MPFTDRYIKVPITIQKEIDLNSGLNKEGIAVDLHINPYDISYYHSEIDEQDNSQPLSKTQISFRNGTFLLVDMYLYEFEQLLNSSKHV